MAQMQVEHSPGTHPFMRSPHYRSLCVTAPTHREQQGPYEEGTGFSFEEPSRRSLENGGPLPHMDWTRSQPGGDGVAAHGESGSEHCLSTAPQQGLARIRQLETRLMARESKGRDVLDSALDFFENPFSSPEQDEEAEDWEESNAGPCAFASPWQPETGIVCGKADDESLDSLEEDDEEIEMEDDDEDEWVPPFASEGPAVAASPRCSQGPWSGAASQSLSKKSSVSRNSALAGWRGPCSSGPAHPRKGDWGDRGIEDGSSMAGFPGRTKQEAGEMSPPVKRKRGRPKGSGKKNKVAAATAAAAASQGDGPQEASQVSGGAAAATRHDWRRALETAANGTACTSRQRRGKARTLQHLSAEEEDRAICNQLPKLRIPPPRALQQSEAEEEQGDVPDGEDPRVGGDEDEEGENDQQAPPEMLLPSHRRKRGRPMKASRTVGVAGASGLATPSHLCTASNMGLELPSPAEDGAGALPCRNPSNSPPNSMCSDFTRRSSGLVSDSAADDKDLGSLLRGGERSGYTSSMLTEGAVGPRKGETKAQAPHKGGQQCDSRRGRGRPPKHRKPLTQLQVPNTPEHPAADSQVATPQWPQQPSKAAGLPPVVGSAAPRRTSGSKKEKLKSKGKSKGRTGRPRGRPPKHVPTEPPPKQQQQQQPTAIGSELPSDFAQAGLQGSKARLYGGRKKPPAAGKGRVRGEHPVATPGAPGAPEKRKRGRPRKYPREEPSSDRAAVGNALEGPVESPDLSDGGATERSKDLPCSVSCTSEPGKDSQCSEDENMCLEDRLLSTICAEVPLPESVDDSNLASMTDSWLSSMAPDSFQAGGDATNNDPFSDIKLDISPDQLQLLEVLGE